MIDSFSNAQIDTLPDISKVDFKNIEASYLKVVLINISIVFLVLFVTVFALSLNKIDVIHTNSFWAYTVLSLLFIYTVIISIVGFKKRKYAVREKDISYKKGILFRKLTTVPFNRIQHIEINQGVLSRFFNLVSLSVYTAGDSSDDLKIRGLHKAKATQIKEFISAKIDG